MLRILVDASSLGDDSARRGIGTYVRGLVPALVGVADVEVHALVPKGTPAPEGVVVHPIRRRVAPTRLADLEVDLLLPREIARVRREVDVLLAPSVRPPRRSVLPFVQILYDVIPLVHPDPMWEYARKQWRSMAQRYRRAAAVVAISEASARDGITQLGLDPAKVEAVLCGLTPPDLDRDGAAVREPDDDPPYVLLASTWSPSKGFAEAMAVIGLLADAGYPHRLLIAGHQQPFGLGVIDRLLATASHPERVEILGWVPDLGSLYRGATAVLVPSHIEGFGYPAAEAMAHGAPVVAFDNSSLPEVVAGGGVLVRDRDVAAMAAAVRRIIDDPAEDARLRSAGPARAAELRWDESAERIAAICRRVALRPTGSSGSTGARRSRPDRPR